MEKENKYNNLLIITKLMANRKIQGTDEEIKISKELLSIIELDRENKITQFILDNDERINEILNKINNSIKETIVFDKKQELIKLKEDIITFKNNQYKNNEVIYNLISDKCINSLANGEYSLPTFFSKLIAYRSNDFYSNKHYIINEELVHQLYNLLNQTDKCIKIQEGVRIRKNKEKYQEINDKCLLSLSYKDLLYDNIDLISEYNNITRELDNNLNKKSNRKYHNLNYRIIDLKNRIKKINNSKVLKSFKKNELISLKLEYKGLLKLQEEYEKLSEELLDIHIRLGKINIKLNNAGLSKLITKSDLENLLGNKKLDRISIEKNLKNFRSKEDLDRYYNYLEKEYKKNHNLLVNTFYEEQEFNKTENKDVVNLIKNDYITARNISKFNMDNNKSDIQPGLAIFILETLLKSRDVELKDMNITEEEFNKIDKYYEGIIDARVKVFNNRYENIMKNKELTK